MVKRGRPSSKQSDHSIASKRAKDSLPLLRKKKACEKIHCPCKEPVCFAQASERCTGSFWTSRWYHLSEDEHYCTECFEHFYKSNRPGYSVYSLWKDFWLRDYKGEAAIRLFMADQVLPFWVQCTQCEKWRLLPSDQDLTPDSINDFTCDQIYASSGHPCDQPEATEAQNAILPHWINTLSLAPMLKSSPAFPLLTNYSPVALGMTASKVEYLSDNLQERYLELEKQFEEVRDTNKPFCLGFFDADDNQLDLIKQKLTQPFLDVGEEYIALAMRPDAMEEHEKLIFSEYSKEQAMYLCLRNVIYTLWMKDPTRWLTIQEVAKHLLCRGLSRIRCVYEAQRVLHHLTQRGIVNHGHLIPPPELPRLPPTRVIVVGGGVSGLAAGRHLSNLGMKITVLEAGNRIGGRVQCLKNPDDGLTICSGADRVIGVINNPIASLAFQCGVNLQLQDETQMILQPGGTIVDPAADEAVDDLFGSAINSIIEWRQNLDFQAAKHPQSKKSNTSQLPPSHADRDESLEVKLREALKQLGSEKVLSKEERQVIESYKSLLEICHGTSLSNVSAKMSVQNAFCSQFSGRSAMVPGGIGPLLEDLSSGLEVRLTCEVDSIKLVDSDECRARVMITEENGSKEEIDADYVVVAVPLHVLLKRKIKFEPSLPTGLTDFIGQLGCGVVEQVVAEFPHSFWRPSNEEHRCRLIMRTIDSQAEDERGLFPFFVDVSAYDKDGVERFLLKSYVVGETAKKMKSLPEADVIAEYIRVLRRYFGEIPEPLQNAVSSYASNDHIGMAYTYPKVGSNFEEIRTACDPVIDNTVFFAGEHFSPNFSRTLAGAYLSGLDAAARIVHRSLYGDDVPFIQSGI